MSNVVREGFVHVSRRNALLQIGMTSTASVAQLPVTVLPDHERHGDTIPPDQQFAGMLRRSMAEKIHETLSVLDFGARGDGQADDTAAFRAAVNAAAISGKALFVPARIHGYLISDTIEIRCRRIFGDVNYLGDNERGTLIRFAPTKTTDMKPCLAVVGGMDAGGLIENLTIFGPEVYRRETLGQFVDGSLLPDYAAFAAGTCAIGVYGSNQPIFRNIRTENFKVGLYLDSANGHVSSYDCYWRGLFGVYCHRNSEDYLFVGGLLWGVFACVIFGTFRHANHNGGFSTNMYRVHVGFAPYAFYQVMDSAFTGPCLSLCGRLDSVRFERIGEAILQLLPQSLTRGLAIDSFAMSWSPIFKGYPSPPPSGWLTNLPPDVLPYDQQQRHMFRFGIIGINVRLSWLGEVAPLARSPNASQSGALALIEQLQAEDSCDLLIFRGDIEVRGAIRPDTALRRRRGGVASRGDFQRDMAIAATPNLLEQPESLVSWHVAGGRVSSRLLSSVADFYPPVDMIEEFPGDATVIILDTDNREAVFRLPFISGPPAEPHGRALYLGLWVAGAKMAVSIELAATVQPAGPAAYGVNPAGSRKTAKRFYTTSMDGRSGWQRVTAMDQSPPGTPVALLVEIPPNARGLLAGPMAAYGGPCAYNAANVPRIRGGLALEGMQTGSAAGLAHAPKGYVEVVINGQTCRIPYY